MKLRQLVVVCALALAACSKSTPAAAPDGGPAPEVLHTTYKVIGGISMGAIGASTIGLHHPEKFDGVVALGGPLDATYLSHMIEHQLMAGFCPREELERQLAIDPAGLNDPSVMTCMQDVPGTTLTEHTESFSHWHFTTSGGHFTRSSYLELFYDLTSAFGNLTSYNPDSPIAPQGVPEEYVVHPPADSCQNPYRIPGKLSDPSGHPVYNAEYNPDGLYDAITFCDGEEEPVYYCTTSKQVVDFCANGGNVVPRGEEQSYAAAFCAGDSVSTASDGAGSSPAVAELYRSQMGHYDPCREHDRPVRVAIAFDLNGNGRRDYAEPVVNNSHERFDDVGSDGCDDAHEDGHGGCVSDPAASPFAKGVADPNLDDYDPRYNPLGTENDWRHEAGEPFRDDGLDGVAGTGDFGEGNGQYDESPGLAKMHAYDPRSNYLALDEHQRHSIDMYVEGGLRDIFNFGVAADILGSAVRARDPFRLDAFSGFRNVFSRMPATNEDDASARYADWASAAPNTLLIYGDPNASPALILQGDGDHVGTNGQALKRMDFTTSWVANRWQQLPLPGGPNTGARVDHGTFHSDALGATRDYAIYLPPGYDDPSQADTRYPVLLLLHGYGGDVDQLTPMQLLFETMMTSQDHKMPAVNGRRYIVVFASGRCCFENTSTHERDCTLQHEGEGGWESMCTQGSFYVNASGPHAGDAPRYEDALFDLLDYVDQHYRTLAPADVTVR